MFSRSSSRLVRNFGRKDTLIGCRLSLFGALKANNTKVEEQSFCTSVQATTPTPEKQPRRDLEYSSIDFWKVDYVNRDPYCGNLDDLFRVDSPAYDLVSGAIGKPSLHVLEMFGSMISVLQRMHGMGEFHGQLKPENVLIFRGKYVRTFLFRTGFHSPGGGGPGWNAPEQLLTGSATIKADLFSLGCVLYFVITGGSHPFGQAIDQRDKNIAENKINLSQLTDMPEAFHLISLLLHPEPKLRPPADELMFHPFLWYPCKRIHFLCEFSGRAKKEAKDSSLIKAILKSNAYEVLDPGWGSRISHLTTGSENDIFQDLFGPRNSPESRHYSMLLLKLFLIACKHCRGEYWLMEYINRPAFWRKTRNRPAFWRKTRISSE